MVQTTSKLKTKKLTKAQLAMLSHLAEMGPQVIPGTLGSTARALREVGLIESDGRSPRPLHSITYAGRAVLAETT